MFQGLPSSPRSTTASLAPGLSQLRPPSPRKVSRVKLRQGYQKPHSSNQRQNCKPLGLPPDPIGPFAHPGRSAYVSALASAPRYRDLHFPVPLTRDSAAASRINPLLLQVAIPRSAIVNLTRYQAHPDLPPAKVEEVTVNSTSIPRPAAMPAELLPFVAGRSRAATRANCCRRDRRLGAAVKRTSRSSRTSQASTASRTSNLARPVVHKASGRPS